MGDRLERLADELNPVAVGLCNKTMNGSRRKTSEELKEKVIDIFDQFFIPGAPNRRVISSRVFSHSSKIEYEETLKEPGVLSTYSDLRFLKKYLSVWPVAPYWSKVEQQSHNENK